MTTLIIAEAGVNHNGDMTLAKELIAAAAEAGADLVKFQSFVADSVTSSHAPKAQYQMEATKHEESQLEMLKKLELSRDDHLALIETCNNHNIGFFSTAFDSTSVDLLAELGALDIVKVPSGELTNLPYLRFLIRPGMKVLLSTGMADLSEIEACIHQVESAGVPRNKLTLLHCTTEYPAPMEEVNLMAMVNIGRVFGVQVGYSDHTLGIEVPVAAVALGAKVIEKHFTLDRNLSGPDHRASLEPDELKKMVQSIRNIEKAMGDGIKRPSESELKNKPIVRKSIVAACPIRSGEIFSEQNLTTKRPGTGISPMRWDEIIGQASRRDFKPDDPIEL